MFLIVGVFGVGGWNKDMVLVFYRREEGWR